MLNSENARELLKKKVGKELEKQEKFITASYLESDELYVFSAVYYSINKESDGPSWSVNKKTGEIKIFDPSPDEKKAIRKTFKIVH